jgi:fermentation-respiration switch protein FrsA (DUF1100 family)
MFEPFPGNYPWNLAVNLALACGGNYGEIDRACRPIQEASRELGPDKGSALMFDSWIKVADQVAANAARDEAEGHTLSAGSKYLRAAGYYLSAERMQSRDYAPRWVAYDKGLELFHKGCGLRGMHVEKIEIPYGDTSYSALFLHDGSGTPRPTLVSVNGLDSMKEQVLMGHGFTNLERGLNTLFLDQPGTGEAIRKRGLPAVYNAEAWGTPALEYLLTRSDVLHDKIGIFGLSFGGYHAPRIAANEPRYALCAVLGANHVWGQRQRERVKNEGENPVPHYWDHVMWVFGFEDRDAFLDYADQITLDGQVEKITVPFLITHGENDRQIPAFNAQMSYDQAVNSSKRTMRIFTEADFEVEHCGADSGTGMRDYVPDWCAATFAEMR